MSITHDRPGHFEQSVYDQALRQAFWRRWRHWLGKGCNDLVHTSDLLALAQIAGERDLGLQEVPLTRIVGSSRTHDFDLSFNPRRRKPDDRWRRVAQARARSVSLSPVKLLKVSDSYFVVDGNHRISVAAARGEKTIQATVVEIKVENLYPDESCSRLGFRLQPEGSAAGDQPTCRHHTS